MKRLLITIEAIAHDYIQELDLPFLANKVDTHPAVSFGLGSRPAVAALMGGMLPVCQIPDCNHRDVRTTWANPYFLTHTRTMTDKQFFLTSNGWMIEILLPWCTKEQRLLNFKWSNDHMVCPSVEMIDWFLEKTDDLDSYFGYVHIFESHHPWYFPGRPHGDARPEYREKAVRYADTLVEKLFNARKDEAEIVICSDHNEPPRKVSAANDVPSAKTMLSFFACNDLAYEGQKWVHDHNQWAQEQWAKDLVLKIEEEGDTTLELIELT